MNYSESKPHVWVFFDLDQTIIETYKGRDGKPYYDANGRPLFTREAWTEVLQEEGIIDFRNAVYLGEPWLKLANKEYTNEKAAQVANVRYLEVMEGKNYSELVEIARKKLAPRAVLKPFVVPIYRFFRKHTQPTLGLVTNVYYEICQGLNDARVVFNEIRVCNKPKVVDNRIIKAYEIDVSLDKTKQFLDFVNKNKIPLENAFGFADRHPQDAWVGKCKFVYGAGSDKAMENFVKLHGGKVVLEGKRDIETLIRNLNDDVRSIPEGDRK